MIWVNAFRIFIALVCLISMTIMIVGFVLHHSEWNAKTRDYWYGRLMWTLVGVSAKVEGVIRNTPFRYTIILIAAAALATLKGNLQKGPWGNDK